MPSVDDSHAYVNAAPFVDVVAAVKATGSPPEQIVWLAEIVALIALTVTVNTFDVAVHATLFNVLVTIRR